MSYFLFVLVNIILPIFIQIGIGYVVQKKFRLNTNTMAKIQFYVFIPALLFTQTFSTTIDSSLLIMVVTAVLSVFFSLYIIILILSKLLKYNRKTTSAFANSVCLYNSGNFCIPLILLLYRSVPLAASVQIIIMLTQSMMTNTFGVFNANFGNKKLTSALFDILKIPMFYSVILAVLLRMSGIGVWSPIWNAMTIAGEGLIPLALFTLGAQLAETKISLKIPKVYLSSFLRLILAPMLAYLFVYSLGITGVAAKVIVICSGAPSAINAVLLAIEYDSEPEFTSQNVFMSTLLSSITVTGVIYFVMTFM